MKRKLSQEGLKTLAVVTMLIDHIGAVILLQLFYDTHSRMVLEIYELLRTIGRLAFPIYCFLLVEGFHHTRSPKGYGLRLAIAAILSEIPFDLAFSGGWDWSHQNVMITLLLGLCALQLMTKASHWIGKILVAVPFMLLAEWLQTDYGFDGVLLMVLFGLVRQLPNRWLWHALSIWFVFSPSHLMALNWLGGISVTIQEWAVLAAIPIALYSGEKRSRSKVLQWAFYLFYPVHLTILYLWGLL